MSRKKRSARRPARRTTYETTHDHAATRLEKAVEERTAALLKLDELAREIPYLENLVAALKPPSETSAVNRVPSPPTPPYAPYTPPELAAAAAAAKNMDIDQEEFLQRYMPRAGRITSTSPPAETRPQPDGNSPDPDEFLRDDGGQEILS